MRRRRARSIGCRSRRRPSGRSRGRFHRREPTPDLTGGGVGCDVHGQSNRSAHDVPPTFVAGWDEPSRTASARRNRRGRADRWRPSPAAASPGTAAPSSGSSSSAAAAAPAQLTGSIEFLNYPQWIGPERGQGLRDSCYPEVAITRTTRRSRARLRDRRDGRPEPKQFDMLLADLPVIGQSPQAASSPRPRLLEDPKHRKLVDADVPQALHARRSRPTSARWGSATAPTW